ncbi:MFS transporter [Solihabitans fulvus]|uniref:MFS transporter n=1 Tax=Solihabitans fulvus TaxID=1892852 RepID=A0A5B2WQQ3_9PSEU|nr:MFS transporter [Solihabitans fulvus]KAA2254323.1 MFS transporter [Solihabitans fulvus]
MTEHTGDGPHPKRWWILAVLCLALMVVVLDNTVLNVAIPSITSGLGASTADIQWMINAYSLVLAGMLLTTGLLSDRFGRKRALLLGLVLFGGGSAWAAYAGSAEALIAARAGMGLGAAFLMPGTLAVLVRLFDERERMKAIGIWSAVASLGMAGGPVIGGALIDHFWWGSVFLINVPVAALAILAVARMVPESRDPAVRPPDLVGAALSVITMGSLVWAVISVPQHGWGSAQVLVAVAVGVVGGAAFAWWERRIEHPMLDLGFFANRRFTGAIAGGVLAAFGMGGSLFLLTQHLQSVLGYTPLEAGVRVAPMALTVLLVSSLSGKISAKLGAGGSMAVGMTTVAAGLVALSLVSADSGYGPTLIGLVLIGAGVGVAMPVAANAMMGAIPPDRAGIASGLNGTLTELGNSFGIAVLGSLLAARFAADLPTGLGEGADRSLPSALIAAAHAADPAGMVHAVRTAFVSGMSGSLLIGAGAALLGGITSGLLLRRGERAATPTRETVGV